MILKQPFHNHLGILVYFVQNILGRWYKWTDPEQHRHLRNKRADFAFD